MTESVTDYRALFESMPGTYLVLAPDLSIVAVSDAYLRATMTQREKLVGHPLFEVYHDNPDDPAADGARNLRTSLERVQEQKRADAMSVHKYYIRRPENQGGGFEARHWNPVNSPVIGADGKLTWIIHQLEDALQESEARYRFLFENMLEGYAHCRMKYENGRPIDFIYLHVNEKFTMLTGLKEVEGKWVSALIPGIRESSPELFEVYGRVAATGKPERLEIYIEGLDAWFYIAVYSPTTDHFIFVFDNITLRKKTELALRGSEERHRMMFQNNPLPMWVYDPETLAFLAVNQTAILHYGYSESEFLQMSLKDIRPPEDVARFVETMRGLGVKKVSSKIWRHRKKNGEIITVDISADMIQFAGRPAGLVLANDITERQQVAEKAAQLQAEVTQSALEWRITFDALDTPVLLFGMDETILRMNRAACDLTGRDCLASIDQSLPREDDPFPWPQMIDLTRRAAEGKCQTAVQLTDPGSTRIWDCVARYFYNPDNGTGSVVFAAREITNLVRLQESLRRGEMMSSLGSLVAGVAHEVRNPLFGIVATLDAFEANHGDKPEFREYISILRGETDRLSALMKDLLEYGRPPELNPDRGSIESLLQDALKPVQALAEPAGVQLKLDCAAGLPEASFDRSRLPQVFINLLDNAVRHSPSGGTIRLSAALAAVPGWLEIAVADDGPGIKPEDIPRLFQPFFTRRSGGTGLGLAIVQRIVEQHGGHITAANRPEGGAVFTVRLPIADPSH